MNQSLEDQSLPDAAADQPIDLPAPNPDAIAAAIANDAANDGKPEEVEAEVEEEIKEPPKSKLKKWPKNRYSGVFYHELISPLKAVVDKGYRLIRQTTVQNFDYDGFNIGLPEQQHLPPPDYYFTEKFLKLADERDNLKLIDVVFQIVFCLGLEQGRRDNRRHEGKPVGALIDAYKACQANNRKLRLEIDRAKVENELRDEFPSLSKKQFARLMDARLSKRKKARFEEARAELGEDPLRFFNLKAKKETGLKKMAEIVSSLDPATTPKEKYLELFKLHEWNVAEFIEAANKKDVKFSLPDGLVEMDKQ